MSNRFTDPRGEPAPGGMTSKVFLRKRKTGYIPFSKLEVEGSAIIRKSHKITRIYYKNFNSLNSKFNWKPRRLNKLTKALDLDMVCGTESNINWGRVNPGSVAQSIIPLSVVLSA